ncbi:MAG TPA: ribosome maturation factor RimP [Aeromicrobium sp.]|nr:ribosome maturation factor RimP [Aeromicrobium sp.]
MAEHLPPGPLADLIEKCVADLGLDVDAVELRGSGPKRLLRVVIDRDGGVPLDVITDASRELSRELDRSELMGATGYTLEVTSRGVDRPLTLPRHWRRNVGRLVIATTTEGERVRGRIATVTADHVELESGEPLPFVNVKSAFVQPELKPHTSERNA